MRVCIANGVAAQVIAFGIGLNLVLRARFNPELNAGWFSAMMEVINNVSLLSVILAGAALIRERERGTIEHLLVMPVRPIEIMLAKIWPMAFAVFLAALVALEMGATDEEPRSSARPPSPN